MLVKVSCNWDVSFRCELISVPGQRRLEIREFVDFYIPIDFGHTWVPQLSSWESTQLPKRCLRKTIRLFRRQPVDPERFFSFLRCLVTPAFWRNARPRFAGQLEQRPSPSFKLTTDEISSSIGILVFVVYAVPQPSVHLVWYRRILVLINEFIHVYEVMAWLSTLGGAYSAMGDYCDRAKGVAKQISAKQLQLAARLGDPTLVCRCWIFLAMSAIQHGRLDMSRQILKRQWRFAHTPEGQRDPRLKNMVQGVWSKLAYERKLAKLETPTTRQESERYSREAF